LALFAAIFYFAPLYLEGLAANWEILIFVAGLILIALEIFVIPGFGVAGITGITLAIVGLALSLLNNINFDFSLVRFQQISLAFLTVLMASASGLIGAYFLSRKMFSSNTGPFRHLSLKTVQNVGEGFVSVETQMFSLIGKKGITATMLRPSGKVTIEGEIYDAKAENGYIEKGEKVVVTRVETTQVYVEREDRS
jgi:membrane-bound serine protease (ClpP class)